MTMGRRWTVRDRDGKPVPNNYIVTAYQKAIW